MALLLKQSRERRHALQVVPLAATAALAAILFFFDILLALVAHGVRRFQAIQANVQRAHLARLRRGIIAVGVPVRVHRGIRIGRDRRRALGALGEDRQLSRQGGGSTGRRRPQP